MLAVDRHQLGARACARARCTTGPAAMSDSLLASARRRPASRVARVTDSPAKPTTPLTTTSASVARLASASAPPRTSHSGSGLGHHGGGGLVGDGHDLGPVRPGPGRRARRGRRPVAPSAASSKRSGSAATTSSVWVPIEPVDPARATRMAVMAPSLPTGPDAGTADVGTPALGAAATPAGRRARRPPAGLSRRGRGPGRRSRRRAGRRACRRSGRARRRGSGRIEPMSLRPRSRLNSDSARSPSGATRAHDQAEHQRLTGAEGPDAEQHAPRRTRRRGPTRCRRARPSTVLFGRDRAERRAAHRPADEEATDVVGHGRHDGDDQDADALGRDVEDAARRTRRARRPRRRRPW